LDTAATKGADGYDEDFREPIVTGSTTRTAATQYKSVVRVPCQVEPIKHEELEQMVQGDTPLFQFRLVLHRADLDRLALIDSSTRQLQIRVNDKVTAIEAWNRPGTVTVPLPSDGLFIVQIQPASFGFGPDGFDLHLVFLSERRKAV